MPRGIMPTPPLEERHNSTTSFNQHPSRAVQNDAVTSMPSTSRNKRPTWIPSTHDMSNGHTKCTIDGKLAPVMQSVQYAHLVQNGQHTPHHRIPIISSLWGHRHHMSNVCLCRKWNDRECTHSCRRN
eukprot:PhF_6_TR40451/c0_g1_i1/m.60417